MRRFALNITTPTGQTVRELTGFDSQEALDQEVSSITSRPGWEHLETGDPTFDMWWNPHVKPHQTLNIFIHD